MTTSDDATLERLEERVAPSGEDYYELTLFVSGASDLAARAIASARRLCDVHLAGRCHLVVVDVQQDLTAVLTEEVLATPTLVRRRPLPVRKVVGDLSCTDKVVLALGLEIVPATSREIG